MNPLVVRALKKADQIRTKLERDIFEPVNIFDDCAKLGLTVRFIDVNMEGMYISQEDKNSTILLSNQRPLPRRCFTCAHELGHHVFGHGTKVDALTEEGNNFRSDDDEEFLVDVFAGALLMPIAGIQREFLKRNWSTQTASPMQFYTISNVFGTGYATLITHCRVNRLIDDAKAKELLKTTPAKLLKMMMGSDSLKSYFKIIDPHSESSLVDLEVSNYLFLSKDVEVTGNHLEKVQQTDTNLVYVARKPGIIRVATTDNNIAYFVRIQNSAYIGLAENRHLEDLKD